MIDSPAEPVRTPSTKGMVFLAGAGPGDPGLITLRAIECLEQAQVVVHDRLVNRLLLRYAPQAEWIDVGKCPEHHPVPQDRINALLIEKARLGQIVVRLKGGDPFVFGRGGEEALALVEAGIPFEIVPGITSAVAVPAYAGIPVTQRNVAGSLTIVAGRRSRTETSIDWFDDDSARSDTLVFLMGVQNLPLIVNTLLERGRPPETPIALIQQGSMPSQKVVVGTLASIMDKAWQIQPPAIAVVGEVVQLHQKLAWFDNLHRRPLLGLRVVNTRPLESGLKDGFSERLIRLGAQVLELPAVRIVPPHDPRQIDSAIHRLSVGKTYDWILFTSANAVRFFIERLLGSGCDLRALAGARLGAVGEATRDALGGYHLNADFCPARFTGLDWVAEAGDLSGQRILLPRSAVAGSELVQALESRGAIVDAVTAYSIAASEPDPEVLDELVGGTADLAAFFSPSALNGIIDMLSEGRTPEAASGILQRTKLACIGPTTAAALRAQGLEAEIQAEDYTVDGLVAAIVKWNAQRRTP